MSRAKIDEDLIRSMHNLIVDRQKSKVEEAEMMYDLYFTWSYNSVKAPMFFLVDAFRLFKRQDSSLKVNETLAYIKKKLDQFSPVNEVVSGIDLACARGYIKSNNGR